MLTRETDFTFKKKKKHFISLNEIEGRKYDETDFIFAAECLATSWILIPQFYSVAIVKISQKTLQGAYNLIIFIFPLII